MAPALQQLDNQQFLIISHSNDILHRKLLKFINLPHLLRKIHFFHVESKLVLNILRFVRLKRGVHIHLVVGLSVLNVRTRHSRRYHHSLLPIFRNKIMILIFCINLRLITKILVIRVRFTETQHLLMIQLYTVHLHLVSSFNRVPVLLLLNHHLLRVLLTFLLLNHYLSLIHLHVILKILRFRYVLLLLLVS